MELWIKRRRLTFPSGVTVGSKYCVDNPLCCGSKVACKPTGTNGIRVEKTRLYLPPGATLGPTWCETLSTCCREVGCSGCAPTKYVVELQQVLDLTCTCNTALSGVPVTLTRIGTSCTWTGSKVIDCGGSSKTITYELYDNGIAWVLNIKDGSTLLTSYIHFHSVSRPVDAWRCDGQWNTLVQFSNPGGLCIWGPTAIVRAAVGSNCEVKIRWQRVYLPGGVTKGDSYCLRNPAACCEAVVQPLCCKKNFPATLYAVLDNVVGCNELIGKVLPMTWNGALWINSLTAGTYRILGPTQHCQIQISVGCVGGVRDPVRVFTKSSGATCGNLNVSSPTLWDCATPFFWTGHVSGNMDTGPCAGCCGAVSFDLTIVE